MSNVQLMDCTSATAIKLERVNFFNRQLLTADDMTTERDYFLQKLRRHNRFMHGWGVVCGLSVTAASIPKTPWRVQIGSGYALGPYGDEIFVGEAVYFDLAACISGGVTNPCEPNLLLPGAAGTSTTVYLAIKYAECLARPVQVAYSGCGCDDDPCQYSRICDSFQIQCLSQLPEQPRPPRVTLCEVYNGALAACPPCPTNPWIALAAIKLPSLSSTSISDSMIVTKGRPTVLSTAILQEQIISCCCKEQPPPSTVGLKDIMVRPWVNPTIGKNDIPWSTTATLDGNSSPQKFDFIVDLTGPAPAGGLSVTVTASYSAQITNVTIPPSVVVAETDSASQPVLGNQIIFSAGNNREALTVTLTATDGKNTATATLQIPPFVEPAPK